MAHAPPILATMIRVRMESPIGVLCAFVHRERLVALDFDGSRLGETIAALARRFGPTAFEDADDVEALQLRTKFCGYFETRDLGVLDDIPVEPGGTPFQQAVWNALRRIPPGRTRAYAEIADEDGAPGAVRAVGAANGANPIPIVIPCHRVVRSGGGLGGYGGGLERKTWLLAHERSALPLQFP